MAADAFECGEHPGDEAADRVRVGKVACVGSQVADFSRAFSQLTLMGVACEIRAAGAGAKRAGR